VREEVLREAEGIAAGHPVLSVLPYRKVRAGAVITGREVYEGRVKDAFGPLLRLRLESYGSTLVHMEIVPDEVTEVARALTSMLGKGVDMVLVTGGMSPDDCTVEGIRRSGAEVVFHGVPVSPGAMSVLAYAGEVPVVGIPAGLLARPRGFLDLVLPRLLAGERLGREDVARYGYGGLCWGCAVCVFPACPFGKGG
jgi:molybdopterin biosynthesis enzyme